MVSHNDQMTSTHGADCFLLVFACCSQSHAFFRSSVQSTGQTSKFKLPPIDYSDPNRCVLKSSSIGQANAARDKLYDLRACNIPEQKAVGYDLSGVITTKTDLRKSNFQDAQFSKAYLHGKLLRSQLRLMDSLILVSLTRNACCNDAFSHSLASDVSPHYR
jgi:uncharacterized protein YjbI with pentapeptide repeats